MIRDRIVRRINPPPPNGAKRPHLYHHQHGLSQHHYGRSPLLFFLLCKSCSSASQTTLRFRVLDLPLFTIIAPVTIHLPTTAHGLVYDLSADIPYSPLATAQLGRASNRPTSRTTMIHVLHARLSISTPCHPSWLHDIRIAGFERGSRTARLMLCCVKVTPDPVGRRSTSFVRKHVVPARSCRSWMLYNHLSPHHCRLEVPST